MLFLHRLIFFWKMGEAVAQRRSVKKVFLKTSQNSQGNTGVTVSFFNKTFIAKFLRTPFLTEHLPWLLLTKQVLLTCNCSEFMCSCDWCRYYLLNYVSGLVSIYLFTENNRNTKTLCDICSKLTINK